MASKYISFIIIVLALMINSCVTNNNQASTALPTSFISSVTLTPTLTSQPTATPPPLATPTVTPVEGITSTQVNVRAEPSTVGAVLGVIPADMRVEIVGKDPGGNWWQILFPQGPQDKGWVTAQYITTINTPEVPVIGGGPDPNNGNVAVTAIVEQQLNIRSGPGADFNSLGTLNPQDVVSLTGKDANGGWLQIDFASGPDGKGWISAAFVQAQGVENLPIIAESGAVVGTGTPTEVPLTPTPTVVPAPADNDSAQSPAIKVTLSAAGSQSFQYSSDVSSPDGDNEDWIQFTPFTGATHLELDCVGNGTLTVEILESSAAIQRMDCDESLAFRTIPGSQYTIHIKSNPSNGLQYTAYTVWVDSSR